MAGMVLLLVCDGELMVIPLGSGCFEEVSVAFSGR